VGEYYQWIDANKSCTIITVRVHGWIYFTVNTYCRYLSKYHQGCVLVVFLMTIIELIMAIIDNGRVFGRIF
jgi:hypothetical protein